MSGQQEENSHVESTDVLIVGGGIGGLTLALICRRLGIAYLVLERSEKITPQGAGISLSPNALRVLDQLGIYEHVKREGQGLRKQLIYRNTTKWRELDLTGSEEYFGYAVHSIERHSFHQLLHQAAGGDEFVRYDCKVDDLVDDPESPFVQVTTANRRQFNGRVVVGADGIRSVTRRLLARNAGEESVKNTIKFTGMVHMSGYTAPIPNLTEKELGVGSWMLYDRSILTTWPCKDNRQMYIGVKRVKPDQKSPDLSVWNATTKTTINEVYGERFHPFSENERFEDIVNESERVVASNVFMEVKFPSMSSGRVALLGDAAHAMSSFFGQGACQAIEDATELSNLLFPYFTQDSQHSQSQNQNEKNSIEDLLKQYSAIRHTRAKAIASFSWKFAIIHMALLPLGLGRLIRSLLYRFAPLWFFMWSLNWLYGYQPIVAALPLPKTTNRFTIGKDKQL